MKAMILAAGCGTRLKPLTDNCPKALISIAGEPLLSHILKKLEKSAVKEVIINVHHHAQMVITYLHNNKYADIKIKISREKNLLDTGGGLKKAAWFFKDRDAPFYLHNVDVLSSINLREMMQFHLDNNNLATLAVKKRKTSRYLLFDTRDSLIGWQSLTIQKTEMVRKTTNRPEAYSFLGIHILSPEIFNYLPEDRRFSIINAYLKIAERFESIRAYKCEDDYWFDVGKKENLHKAEEFFGQLNRIEENKNE